MSPAWVHAACHLQLTKRPPDRALTESALHLAKVGLQEPRGHLDSDVCFLMPTSCVQYATDVP